MKIYIVDFETQNTKHKTDTKNKRAVAYLCLAPSAATYYKALPNSLLTLTITVLFSRDSNQAPPLPSIPMMSGPTTTQTEPLLARKRPMFITHLPPSGAESNNRSNKQRSSSPPRSATSIKAARSTRKAMFIKYGSLLLLVGQMVGLVLLMRYSRTRHSNNDEDDDMYLASTAVFMMEVLKFCICIGVVFYQGKFSLKALRLELYTHIWASPYDLMKLAVPSFLYTVQNNLLYLALSNLDAATYQVLYQLKILTTAIFSATMLGRKFSTIKWISLIVLTCGVAIVEISGSNDHSSSSSSGKTNNSDGDNDQNNRLVGLIAVLCAACTSGFSGVYFEKILKGSEVTLWIRNIQMGIFSIAIAFLTAMVQDSTQIAAKGFFVGYSPIVLTVITVQAVGGLIVAVVVKYADNVLKVFATSFSILLSCVISALAFDFRPNKSFLLGASLVLLSTIMYSSNPRSVKKSSSSRLSVQKDTLPMLHQETRKSSLVL